MARTMCVGVVYVGVVSVGAALSACSSSSSVDEPEVRAAAVYESIVRWFAEADETDPDPLPLYVEPRGEGTEIALAVQAELVGAVQEVAAVRFVDSRDEALITNDADPPVVANDGVLVRLGPVNDTSRVVSIDVDVYDERADAEGVPLFRTFEFQLISAGERWVVSGAPDEVPSR